MKQLFFIDMLCIAAAIVNTNHVYHIVHYTKINTYHILLLLLSTYTHVGSATAPSKDSHSESTDGTFLGIQTNLTA